MPILETSLILDRKCLLIPVHEGNNQAHKTYFTSPSPMRCPTGLSHEIGPFSCRGPLCLREWMRARREASRTFLPFFSILNDGNQRIAGSRLWVPLLGLKTGKHASCQHRFHRTLLVVSFVSVSKVLPDFFISLLHLATLPFWQAHQSISLLGLNLVSGVRKPKGPLHVQARVSQFKTFVTLQTSP